MDDFLSQLSSSVEQKILYELGAQLRSFAAHVVELPEMKEKNITVEQVLECWNSVSDFKISSTAAVSSVPPTSSAGSATPRTRSTTDSSRKCCFKLQRGDRKDQECGRNCVVETDYCSEHLKKQQKKSSPSSPSSPASSVNSPVSQSATAAPVPLTAGGCQHALESGVNKGNLCGKKVTTGSWCTVHAKKHAAAPQPVSAEG